MACECEHKKDFNVSVVVCVRVCPAYVCVCVRVSGVHLCWCFSVA